MKNKGLLIGGGVIGVILVLVLLWFGISMTANNGAVKREANIETSELNINTEESRRVSLFNNLVDAIESYNSHEKDIMTAVAEARKQAESGNIEEAKLVVNAVAENYPELQSQANYKEAMTEFSVTENRIAKAIKSYNSQIKAYDAYFRTQPRAMFLGGYIKQEYEPKVVPVPVDAHMNLFTK